MFDVAREKENFLLSVVKSLFIKCHKILHSQDTQKPDDEDSLIKRNELRVVEEKK